MSIIEEIKKMQEGITPEPKKENKAEDLAGKAKDSFKNLKEGTKQKAAELKEKAKDTAAKVEDKAENLADKAKDKLSETRDDNQEAAGDKASFFPFFKSNAFKLQEKDTYGGGNDNSPAEIEIPLQSAGGEEL